MSAERALHAALADQPADELTWLAYADWLEEQGGERHLFVRLLLDLARGAEDEVTQTDLRRRFKRLRGVDPEWRERIVQTRAELPLRFRVTGCRLHRSSGEMFDRSMTHFEGFLEQGTMRRQTLLLVHRRGAPALSTSRPFIHALDRQFESRSAGQEPFVLGVTWMLEDAALCERPLLVTQA
jgi:uncharacterized protein (TIGR02996 family)